MPSNDPIDPAAFRDFEQTGWQRAAAHYADAFGRLTALTAPAILEAVKAGRGTKILDVATGPGYLAAEANARGAIAAGLDFSSAMIAEARRNDPDITFIEGDAESLPFPDRDFDAVVMNFGMLHLARPEAAIAEAWRVLRSGGRYAFTVWAGPDLAVGFGCALKAIEVHGNTNVGLPPGPPFFRFSDGAECRRCLEQAGFEQLEVRTIPLTWRVASAGEVFEALTRGGVRTAAVLRAQKPEALQRIRSAIEVATQAYADEGGLALPMPAVLASGVKP